MPLVGIARLAAESELLEAKRAVEYFEIPTRSLLNRTKPNMPFHWTINPYRGCEFGCKYCYARYAHEFMELDAQAFEDKIYVKESAAFLLKRELVRASKAEAIAIGTATDPYQPAERRFGRTRSILEVFAREHGWHLGLITKSDLITRDLELLREIAQRNVLNVHLTVTTTDEKLARLLEPRAPRPELRLQAVQKLRSAGICVGVNPNPIMPGITDSEAALDGLARAAKERGALTLGGGALYLPSAAQKVFLPFLEREFPHLAERYRKAFEASIHLSRAYKDALGERVRRIRERYGLASGIIEYRPELWAEEEQMDLFAGDGDDGRDSLEGECSSPNSTTTCRKT
ncbi:MAG TPA: radical SAM protein [Candidatus Acidoferrales bacterium]|nr:radical SAM protein [Candidatus Acidoferrales bacterium]